MVQLTEIVEELSTVLDRAAAEKIGKLMLQVYERLHESLVLQRLDSLENALKQFAESMSRSQEQLVKHVEEQLAAHRRETDERFRELREEFQEYRKLTDERFRDLAEAARLTQEALRDLVSTVKDLQKQVGGLSQAFGYVLENEAMKRLPKLLLRDYGLRVEGRLKRGYVQDSSGRHVEVNLFGKAKRNGEQVTIVGESKSQLSKRDVNRFL